MWRTKLKLIHFLQLIMFGYRDAMHVLPRQELNLVFQSWNSELFPDFEVTLNTT